MANIKFVWEFFGPDSISLSEHHLVHLKEFFNLEGIDVIDCGFVSDENDFSYTYVDLSETYLNFIRSKLKPHKAFKI
jgi:hypothetical protein